MRKKASKKTDDTSFTQDEVDEGVHVMGQMLKENLEEHNLREQAVMLHGKQAGMLTALGICGAMMEAGASPGTMMSALSELHDDWVTRADFHFAKLKTLTGQEPANLPCGDCGGPVADCEHERPHSHTCGEDDEEGENDE